MKQIKLLFAAVCALLVSSNAMATTYYLTGSYNSWAYTSSYAFTETSTSGVYTFTASSFSGTFKITDGSTWYGTGNTSMVEGTSYSLSSSSSDGSYSSNSYSSITFTLTVTDDNMTISASNGVLTNLADSDHVIYLDGTYCSWGKSYQFTENSKTNYTLTLESNVAAGLYSSSGSQIKVVIDGTWLGIADDSEGNSVYNIDEDTEYQLGSSNDFFLNEAPCGAVTFTVTVYDTYYTVSYVNDDSCDDGSVYLACANLQTDETSSDWGTAAFTAEEDGNGDTYYTLTTDVTNLYDETEGYLAFKIVIDDNWYGLADDTDGSVYNISCEAATALGSENNIYLDTNVDISSTSTLTLTVTLVDEVYYLTVSGGCTNTAIEAVSADAADAPMPVYSISGAYITTVSSLDDAALKQLPKGLYIVGGQRYLAK